MGCRICGDGDDVGTVHIFGGNEAKALITGCALSSGFGAFGERGFPHHVRDAIADLEQRLHNVRCERMRVESQGTDLGNMSAQGAVDARAFNANDNTEVDANPFDLLIGVALCTPAIALVVLSDNGEELRGVFF